MRPLDYFFAARPLLQLPIWTVYLVCLHYHLRLSGGAFGWLDLAVMAGMSLIFTAAVYLNQVYDYESDRINRKVGFLQRGILTCVQLSSGAAVGMILPMAAAPLIGLPTMFIFAQLLLLAYFYSVPPVRLKDRPVGGLLANAYGHGTLVAVAIMPDLSVHNAGLLGWDNPLYFFLTVGGTYLLTTIPDRAGDAATGKRTLAVVIGPIPTMAAAALLYALAALVAYRSGFLLLSALAAGALALTLLSIAVRRDWAVLLAAKLPLLALTLLAGYFFPGYLGFVVALLIGARIYYRRRFGIVYPRLT